jgi:hypothetical protein
MRAWTRTALPTMCGGCNRQIATGEAVLVIGLVYHGGKEIRRLRCDRCEGPAPPDLPAFVERTNAIAPTPLQRVRPTLPLGTPLADWRARQSGDREPGEEG